jgi:hypothetical protein
MRDRFCFSVSGAVHAAVLPLPEVPDVDPPEVPEVDPPEVEPPEVEPPEVEPPEVEGPSEATCDIGETIPICT